MWWCWALRYHSTGRCSPISPPQTHYTRAWSSILVVSLWEPSRCCLVLQHSTTYSLTSFSGLPIVKFLIACVQYAKTEGKAWSILLREWRQGLPRETEGGGGVPGRKNELHAFSCDCWPKHWIFERLLSEKHTVPGSKQRMHVWNVFFWPR